MVCNRIFSLFLSCVLVVVFLSSSMALYLHDSSDIKFYIGTFQKKIMIREMPFLNHESPCHPLKIFRLLNKRKKRRNNVRQTAVILFSWNARYNCAFIRDNKSLKLVRYEILLYLIAGVLDSFLIYLEISRFICNCTKLCTAMYIAVQNCL